jgi:hypothetical protein
MVIIDKFGIRTYSKVTLVPSILRIPGVPILISIHWIRPTLLSVKKPLNVVFALTIFTVIMLLLLHAQKYLA